MWLTSGRSWELRPGRAFTQILRLRRYALMLATGSSIQLIRLFGIRIGASPSWFVVLFIVIYLLSRQFQGTGGSSEASYLIAVIAAALFFGSIVLHELGHALMARRLGIGVSGIDLWFFGGIMKMERDADSPSSEFRVAAAGPAVTALIFGLCLGVLLAIGVAPIDALNSDKPVEALLGFIGFMNGLVFVFNMAPAFPLDGGRIARAAIWALTGDRNKATRAAGRVGQGFAYVMIGFGVFIAARGGREAMLNGVYLAVLGWLLGQAARSAVVATDFTERIDGVTVADIMDAEAVTMPAMTTMSQAQDEYFLRYRYDWFPVVDDHGRFLGVVREQGIDDEIAAGRPALAVSEIVQADEAESWRVPPGRALGSLLGDERLRTRGALMAVDGEGVLRGVVTIDQVRRALSSALPQGSR
jgi:Zn-dependent protease